MNTSKQIWSTRRGGTVKIWFRGTSILGWQFQLSHLLFLFVFCFCFKDISTSDQGSLLVSLGVGGYLWCQGWNSVWLWKRQILTYCTISPIPYLLFLKLIFSVFSIRTTDHFTLEVKTYLKGSFDIRTLKGRDLWTECNMLIYDVLEFKSVSEVLSQSYTILYKVKLLQAFLTTSHIPLVFLLWTFHPPYWPLSKLKRKSMG